MGGLVAMAGLCGSAWAIRPPSTGGAAASETIGATVVTGGDQGSVLFVSTSGVLGQNNSQLKWLESSGQLLVGNAVPNTNAPKLCVDADCGSGFGLDDTDNPSIIAGAVPIAEFNAAGIRNQKRYGVVTTLARGQLPTDCAYTVDVDSPNDGIFLLNSGTPAYAETGEFGFSVNGQAKMIVGGAGVSINTSSVTPTSALYVGAETGTSSFTVTRAGNLVQVGAATFQGNVTLSSNSIVDAYNTSFGAVTAGSTSTLTWTEVTDRLGEFVTSSFTATTSGYYEVIAHAGASQTAGTACILLKVDGSLINGGEACNQGVTGLASILDVSVSRILNLTAGQIVRFDASATTANATFQKLTMTIKRVP